MSYLYGDSETGRRTFSSTHRAGFLKSAGLLVVSFGVSAATAIEQLRRRAGADSIAGPYPDPDFHATRFVDRHS